MENYVKDFCKESLISFPCDAINTEQNPLLVTETDRVTDSIHTDQTGEQPPTTSKRKTRREVKNSNLGSLLGQAKY